MITRLQSVLAATPTPSIDSTIRIVHYDAQDDVVFWCGYTNGHDGQGWTADESEALKFTTFSAANAERKVAKRWHPKLSITLRGEWMVAS